jgi:hypothetical protein
MIKGKKGMVAITIVLVLAMVMSIASAGPNVKESLKQHKERLNPVEDKEELQHKEELRLSEPITFPLKRVANELIYDDGAADGCYDWTLADGGFAVRFTPPSYPVNLETARICLCQDWPDSDHEQFAVEVYDDNGIGGAPGTKLGGPVYHTATDWGWCDVDISGLGITINSGGFYIAYIQLTDPPNCEALSYDNDTLYGRSWDWNGVDWVLWTAENYMIRCVVDDSSAKAKWTYMVYLDGDNNLEGAAIDDFMEMSSVGSTSNVNIVVQFDRIPGYSSAYGDWTDCKQFHVTAGMTPTAANALIDLGECNMGDPNTLGDFVDWAMTEFPADNYALVLWNHGDGWKSINNWVPWADDIKDAKDAGLSRGICVDNTNNDYLSLQETEVALTGKYVQLLGYDACLMHMVEVVYQVRTNAGVSVGSEESEPGAGWPYDTILADLTGTPTMSEDALGTVIVDRYMDSYGYTGSETQSAVDNGDVSGLVTAVDNLAQVLIDEINGGHWTQVQQARNAAEEIYYPYYIDLYHFAEMVDAHVTGAAAQAQAVMYEVSKMYEAHGTSVPNDHGLSMYYPRVEGDYLASYDSTAFASDTQWNEFLKKYYNVPEPILCTDPDPPSHGFGSVPEGQTRDWSFDITNCGEGTLTWTVSDDQSWITVTPPSDSTTTETDAVTVSIDTTGLGSGITHTGTVTVSSNGGTKQGLISVYVPEPGTHVAYLKKGAYGATDYDLYIYSAPTTIGEHSTLTASDKWSPDGNTVAITAVDIDGDGVDEIAYLKKGAYGATDYDLYIYTAPTTIREHGTLTASDKWSPDGNTVAITAVDIDGDGVDEIAYLKQGAGGDTDYDLYVYTAPTAIGEHGILIASDYWAPDGNTVGIAAIGGGNEIAYLKEGAGGAKDYNLYVYTAPATVGQHGTLIASDYWSPDGSTVGIAAIGGGDEIAYLKQGPGGPTDYDLYIYTAPATVGQHGTLTASDLWSPDGQTEGISALG